jgi:hypothetical protein
MWHELEFVSDSCSSIQNGRFASQISMAGKTPSIIQLKKMNGRKSQDEKKSKYSKNEKRDFCVLLQDSSKSLEDKCVYTRLYVFSWITIASNSLRIFNKNQSGQYFQKIWTCVSKFLDSSKDSKTKSVYSHLHACKWSKTSIQKNRIGLFRWNNENVCRDFIPSN